MWNAYRNLARRYPKIQLIQERNLIRETQKGSKKSKEEIILRHIGFLIFRIHRKAFPELVRKYGEDLLEDSILILYQKVETYNLKYRDKYGNLKPVKFVSYIWKRIDGFIIDSVKKELAKERLKKHQDSERISSNNNDNDNIDDFL